MKEPQGSEEFIAEQKRILAEDPECANSHYNLGVEYMKKGEFDEAIEAFNEAIANSARMFEGWVNLGYIYFKQQSVIAAAVAILVIMAGLGSAFVGLNPFVEFLLIIVTLVITGLLLMFLTRIRR